MRDGNIARAWRATPYLQESYYSDAIDLATSMLAGNRLTGEQQVMHEWLRTSKIIEAMMPDDPRAGHVKVAMGRAADGKQLNFYDEQLLNQFIDAVIAKREEKNATVNRMVDRHVYGHIRGSVGGATTPFASHRANPGTMRRKRGR
jgi:hypothetical protein